MNVLIENLRPFVSEVELKQDHQMFKDVIVVDYGVKTKGSERVSQIRITHDSEDTMIKSAVASCQCTTPDIKTVDDKVQVINIGYNTNILGKFEKQVTLYTKDKVNKQIIKLTGEIIER